jgi:hypothetical protein
MDTIYSLLKRAKELKEKSQVDSITPEEVGKLHEDTLAYIASLEQSTDGLGIKKVYQSKSAMEADTDPVGTNGKALRYGQLVSIFDDAHADSSENGNIYAFQKPGWLLMGKVSGGTTLSIAQELGDSAIKVMSQKAVTKSLREVKKSVPNIVVKSAFGKSKTDSISQAQVTTLAKGVYISKEDEVYKPIAPQTSNVNRWRTAGVAYNTNLTVLGCLVKAIQFIGSASDIEVGVVNIDTKEMRSVKTINSSDMTDGVPYELTLDEPLQLEGRETMYVKGVVYFVPGQIDGLYVLPNNTGTGAYTYILMKCVEYKYGNFSEELKAISKANLQATLGGLTASKDNYAWQWAGTNTRVGANSIITELRYKAAENSKAVYVKVVSLSESNKITFIRDYVFLTLSHPDKVKVNIPITPNDIILCKNVVLSTKATDNIEPIYWSENVDIGDTLSISRLKCDIALEYDVIADTIVNRHFNNLLQEYNAKFKLAVMGDSIMASDVTNTGGALNAKLGTTLLSTDTDILFGNLACGWATLVDWVKDGVNLSTPTFAKQVSNTPTAANCVTNQLRRLLQHTTAKGEQVKWTHPTEGGEYALPTDVGVGEGYIHDIPDIIFISACTNDWNAGDHTCKKYIVKDDFEEVITQRYSELDCGTFASCIRWIIETLKINYPKAHIIFGNILQTTLRGGYTSCMEKSELIEKICRWEGIPVIDELHESGIGGGTIDFLTRDKLHPNDIGRDLLSSFIAGKIKALVGELQ